MTDINSNLVAQPIDENYRTISGTYRFMGSLPKGTVTTSGTAVQLTATPTQAKAIDIINPTSNADVLVIGDSTVSYANGVGIPLEPGFTYHLVVTDLSKVWVDAKGNGYTFQTNYFW